MARKIQSDIDVEEASADPIKIATVIGFAREMFALVREMAVMEETLKAKAERHAKLEMDILPQAMIAAGMASYHLGESGYTLEVEDFVRATIPSATAIDKSEGPDKEALVNRRDAALAWLRDNKADSLIKNELTADFGKGHAKDAKKFAAMIEKAGFESKVEEAVNFQTLNCFLREELKKGTNVPAETFSMFVGKRAKLKAPKRKKE